MSFPSKNMIECKSAKLCKALYFTASTSSGTVHPFWFSWRGPIAAWRRAGRGCFLGELEDTLPVLTPWLLPHREQALCTTRLFENGRDVCDRAFNVCCFSQPSPEFVSRGCTQCLAKKRLLGNPLKMLLHCVQGDSPVRQYQETKSTVGFPVWGILFSLSTCIHGR